MKEARAYAKAHPKRWKRVGRVQDTWVMNFNNHIIFAGQTLPLRLVLVKRREKVKKVKKGRVHWRMKEYIYGIVTNIARKEKTPNQVYRFYHQRATIENFFRESRQSFHLGKLPSQKFRGNEAYLWFVALAYNCFVWFKRDILPKHMQRRTAQTIRRKLNVEADIQLDNLKEFKDSHRITQNHTEVTRGRLWLGSRCLGDPFRSLEAFTCQARITRLYSV